MSDLILGNIVLGYSVGGMDTRRFLACRQVKSWSGQVIYSAQIINMPSWGV